MKNYKEILLEENNMERLSLKSIGFKSWIAPNGKAINLDHDDALFGDYHHIHKVVDVPQAIWNNMRTLGDSYVPLMSFKQFINEDFPVLVGNKSDTEDEHGHGYPTFSITDLPSEAKSLGTMKVGDDVFHFHHAIEPIRHEFHTRYGVPPDSIGYVTKMTNDKHEVVGHVRFSDEGGHSVAADPVLLKQHRKKGLMSEMYKRWAIGNKKILMSGSYQSHGGRNIWNELANKVDVHLMNDQITGDQRFTRYDPKKTPIDDINNIDHTFVYFPDGIPNERK